MKHYLDIKCERCGWTTSTMWLSNEECIHLAETHVCVDGEKGESYSITPRVIYGPGERRLVEEIFN